MVISSKYWFCWSLIEIMKKSHSYVMCERSTGSCQIISSLRRNRGGASLWNTGLSVFSPGESGPTNSSSIVLRWAASAWAEVGSCGSSGSGMIPVTEARAVWGHCEAVSANWTPVRSTLGTVLGSLWQILPAVLFMNSLPCPANNCVRNCFSAGLSLGNWQLFSRLKTVSKTQQLDKDRRERVVGDRVVLVQTSLVN